jgi:hypothetical protein
VSSSDGAIVLRERELTVWEQAASPEKPDG